MRRFLLACAAVLSLAGLSRGAQLARAGADDGIAHALFTALLQDHVTTGRVDYTALCNDGRLEQYLAQLAATDPGTIENDDDRLAFWINAYNAYTLDVVCENYPIESINKLHFGGLIIGSLFKKTVWDRKFVVVNRTRISLNDVEHRIIRAHERHGKIPFEPTCLPVACPRAHFALVCASKSCPQLRGEAYEGATLDKQLDDQARTFFSDGSKNYFDVPAKTAHLSKILDWYAADFGDSDEERLLFVAEFLPERLASAIRADPAGWKIEYTEYDWSLNE